MAELTASLHDALKGAARDAMEEMFFMEITGEAQAVAAEAGAVRASVEFGGDASGRLAISLSRGPSLEAAANFLGEDTGEVSEDELHSVVAELANILCGAALSRWRHEGQFVLAPPVICGPEQEPAARPECALAVEGGSLLLSLSLYGPGPV